MFGLRIETGAVGNHQIRAIGPQHLVPALVDWLHRLSIRDLEAMFPLYHQSVTLTGVMAVIIDDAAIRWLQLKLGVRLSLLSNQPSSSPFPFSCMEYRPAVARLDAYAYDEYTLYNFLTELDHIEFNPEVNKICTDQIRYKLMVSFHFSTFDKSCKPTRECWFM